ncbi:hypothetical protein A2886_00355 [candidate division WWE3 bacterium RIFCSPHIGHO2_01_FULL_42_13]|uniref:Uncharacterized protein n=1 Tax=candidate division WWE3 bacterium RIFCSPHIGHO2_01_FULL_42_13 TaxID=1802617 RepID=A0A1F4US66_UNCKA|nr:MAG: hypothetical protein A2886_00355 [candidate division WWE3 bacterium RIFCSPHIGHO2_01_FULL_42_13]
MESLFVEISVILLIATALSVLMRILKQPLILGYIITGILVGPTVFNLLRSFETVEAFSKLGIAILLFIVGLGLSPKIIRDVGKVSLITGLGQITLTTTFGFLIATLFGYEIVPALYIAVALTFSSTIIILKLLTDRGDTEKLYGRISIGFLLVQDLVATIIFLAISTFAKSPGAFDSLGFVFLKGLLLLAVLIFVSAKLLPKLGNFLATSGELLFLFSIGWGLGLAILFNYIGFSLEIGALLAGIALSASPYSREIGSKLRSLRDFFLIMFFVLLGARLMVSDILSLLPQVLTFSLFVLVGNPLIVLILMELLGYNKRTSFMAGLTVAQISEFSLILILLGLEIGHVDNVILSLVTLVSLLTIAGASYMIIYADRIYSGIKDFIGLFERKSTRKEFDILGSYDVILFGCSRVGYDFVEAFKNLGQGFLCVDYDPKLIKQLTDEGLNCRYGDVEDIEFLEEANVVEAKLIISTIPDFEASMFLLGVIKHNPDVIVVMVSYSIDDALKLYEAGADYVILPHFIGGRVISEMVEEFGFNVEHFDKEKKKHVKYLQKRKELGHTHPGKMNYFGL